MTSYIILYLAVINIISVFVTILDKHNAKKKKQRVPELTLLLLSAIGGSVGMYITMRIIRHKTRKPKFMVGIPMIIILQAALCVFLWRFVNG